MSSIEKFNFSEIEDFDKHISLSIPDYRGLTRIFQAIVSECVHPQGVCVDVGCSTGRFISSVNGGNSTYIGIDTIDIREYTDFTFIKGCAVKELKKIKEADVICLMFTMQFMGKHKRKELIEELARLNKEGAVILIAEKIHLNSQRISSTLSREHIRTKREGFSDKEILDKDYSLLGSMFCKTEAEMREELSIFDTVDTVWQNYNFKAWCIS